MSFPVSSDHPEPELKGTARTGDRESTVPELIEFVETHRRVTFLGGAGCSTASGIPDYRDEGGNWKHQKPVQFKEFLSSALARQRYWARSFSGWSRISAAQPNRAHRSLAVLESADRIQCLITQNVDNLHRSAGSRNVIDLHGVLQRVRCLDCGMAIARDRIQRELASLNPDWQGGPCGFGPDGDARLATLAFGTFRVPACSACQGILKPDVVFFGEAVPAERINDALQWLRSSEALLVAGTSLMVFSGYRLVRMARELGKPVAIINRGTTRADHLATYRSRADCGEVLASVADHFIGRRNIHARGVDDRI